MRVVGSPSDGRSRVVRDALVSSARGRVIQRAIGAVLDHAVGARLNLSGARRALAKGRLHDDAPDHATIRDRLAIVLRSLGAQAATIAADLLAALPDHALPLLSLPDEVREALDAPKPAHGTGIDHDAFMRRGGRKPIMCPPIEDDGAMAVDRLALGAYRHLVGTPQQTTLLGADLDPMGVANSHHTIRVMQTTPFMPDGAPASGYMVQAMACFAGQYMVGQPEKPDGRDTSRAVSMPPGQMAWRLGVCPGTVLQHVLWGTGTGAVRAWLGLPWDQSREMFTVDGGVFDRIDRNFHDPLAPAIDGANRDMPGLATVYEDEMRGWAAIPLNGRSAFIMRAAGLPHLGYYKSKGRRSGLRMARGAAAFGMKRRLVDSLASPMADAVLDGARMATIEGAKPDPARAHAAERITMGAALQHRLDSTIPLVYRLPA